MVFNDFLSIYIVLFDFQCFLYHFIWFWMVFNDFLYNFESFLDEKSRKWLRFNENRRRLVPIDPQTKNKHLLRSKMVKKRPKMSQKSYFILFFRLRTVPAHVRARHSQDSSTVPSQSQSSLGPCTHAPMDACAREIMGPWAP